MKRLIHLGAGLIALLLLLPCGARAGAELIVAEPPAANPVKIALTVNEDGFARLPLKWSVTPDGNDRVDVSISTFKAAAQPDAIAIVGLGVGPSADGPLQPRLQQLEVGAGGAVILLDGSGLAADVDYVGQLSANVGQRQRLTLELTLLRPAAMMPFRCPAEPQMVQPDGSTRIDLPRLARLDAKAVGLKLTPFLSSDKELIQAGLAPAAAGQALQNELTDVPLSGRSLIPPLRAFGLTEGTIYRGKLQFLLAGRPAMECALELALPKQGKGELAVDVVSLTRKVMLPLFPFWSGASKHSPALSLRLFDKTRQHRIDNITAVLDGPTASAGGNFDPASAANFSVNGARVDGFMQLSAAPPAPKASASRTILPGEQLNVEMGFDRLHAGSHSFGLHFVGGNGALPSPKVQVELNVRHHLMWAVVAVLLSVAVAWVVTKGVVNWRERIRLRHRVAQLNKERFDTYDDIPCVAFLHVVLEQTTLLLERTPWLAAPSSVNDFLARADRVVTVMRRYSALQDTLAAAVCSGSVKDHYRESIAAAMNRVGPQPLDQATADKVVQDLDLVASHLAEDPHAWYRTHLALEAKSLSLAALAVRNQLGADSAVDELLTTLKGTMPAEDDAEGVRKFDDAYWLIRLLVSRRKIPQANDDLIKAYLAANHDIVETFKKADLWAWSRLNDQITQGRVKVEPLRRTETQECLTPITFVLRFDDDWLEDSYFARNVLKYRWAFDFPPMPPPPRWRPALEASEPPQRSNSTFTLNGARVTQYASAPGDMKVSVKISLAGPDKVEEAPLIVSEPLRLQQNSEMSMFAALSGTEILSMGLVFVLTLATSLPALYFTKDSFGSYGDYVAILVWAFGIEQGKNLLQLLKTFPVDTPTAGASP